jgi:ADP-dependent NAD(P)H-hydrate dehydratase / NAD(P)H-hydrate epimerase
VLPILTPAEMAAVDAAAAEPVETLIGRAGAALARDALAWLGGTYGRRVVVVAGKGNNGADGRDAAERLRRKGVRVEVVDAAEAPPRLPPCDLVIDAAYGTGFRGEYDAPDTGGAPVLAADIPSGVDGLTGEADSSSVQAVATTTFAALKPGLVFEPGRSLAGRVRVADIGLDVSGSRVHLVEASDVVAWLPSRPPDAHKWRSAVWIVGGSPGMTGAPVLAAAAAARSGAGYVRLAAPGLAPPLPGAAVEVVGTELPDQGWADEVLGGAERFRAIVVGPGLGHRGAADVRRLVAEAIVPVVVDGDGLRALGTDCVRVGHPTTVLTPHDGEFERLCGHRPGPDRIDAARQLADATNTVVLLKGPATVVARSGGDVLLIAEGDARLATAGTGDVLSGTIAALVARGMDPFRAAAGAAFVHARAAALGPKTGLVASDVATNLPAALDALMRRDGGR